MKTLSVSRVPATDCNECPAICIRRRIFHPFGRREIYLYRKAIFDVCACNFLLIALGSTFLEQPSICTAHVRVDEIPLGLNLAFYGLRISLFSTPEENGLFMYCLFLLHASNKFILTLLLITKITNYKIFVQFTGCTTIFSILL